MPDQEFPPLRKKRAKRIITSDNIELFIQEITRTEFKCFSKYVHQLEQLKEDLKSLIIEVDELNIPELYIADASLEGKYDSLAEVMELISQEMRKEAPEKYSKLTARIFDTIKKSTDYQSVKIRKDRVDELKNLLRQHDTMIEDLIDMVLRDYLATKKMKPSNMRPK